MTNLVVAFMIQVSSLKQVCLPPLLVTTEVFASNRDIRQGLWAKDILQEQDGNENSNGGQDEGQPRREGV
jgi:hypothetical protein